MGRGQSQAAVHAAIGAIPARGGKVEGTALEALLPLTLKPKQETALKALAKLMLENPEAPGFEAYDICDAGYSFASPPGYTLGSSNSTGPILASLAKKGLTERTAQVLKGASGEVSNGERGWRLTEAGLQLAGATAAGSFSFN